MHADEHAGAMNMCMAMMPEGWLDNPTLSSDTVAGPRQAVGGVAARCMNTLGGALSAGRRASASAAPGLDELVVASREEMAATLGVLE